MSFVLLISGGGEKVFVCCWGFVSPWGGVFVGFGLFGSYGLGGGVLTRFLFCLELIFICCSLE